MEHLSGVVRQYDPIAGWGIVETLAGAGFPFHATAIADGSRTIEVGCRVVFCIVGGRQGRWEATDVVGT